MLGVVGLPINSTRSECSVESQLMELFSGKPDLVVAFKEDPETGLPKPSLLPSNLAQLSGIPSFTYYGDYQRCIYSPSMQYCLLEGPVGIPGAPIQIETLMGLCRPASCSEDEVHDDVGSQVSSLGLTKYTTTCHHVNDPPPAIDWSGGQIAALVVFVLIFVLVVAGSALDLCRRKAVEPADSPSAQGSPMLGFLRAWSLPRNISSFSKARRDDPELPMNSLDGLRVLSTLWVILGHTLIWPLLSIGLENAGMILPPYGRLTKTWFMVLPGGYFAVDTFFWLSGMLGAKALHAKVAKSPALLSAKGFCLNLYPMAVFSRWLRLTAVYAFVLLFTQTWYREIGRGGLLWNAGTGGPTGGACVGSVDNSYCKANWWAQLLYVNNLDLFGANSGSCLSWTWYLACDMQMFLILPFLVLLRERAGKAAGWLTVVLLTVASVIANYLVILDKKFVSDPVLGNLGKGNSNDTFMTDVYEASWMRVQPYLVGVATWWSIEFFLARRRSAQERSLLPDGAEPEPVAAAGLAPEPLLPGAAAAPRRRRSPGGLVLGALVLQLLSFAAMCFVVFLPVTRFQCKQFTDCVDVDKAPWSPTVNAAYGALNHLVWSLGLACLMAMCFLRAPTVGWVNWILGRSFWQQPMKLSYSAYLLHPLVLVYFYCSNEKSLPYLDSSLFSNWIAFSTVAFFSAFVVWIFVEKPLANLTAVLLGHIGGGRRAQTC